MCSFPPRQMTLRQWLVCDTAFTLSGFQVLPELTSCLKVDKGSLSASRRRVYMPEMRKASCSSERLALSAISLTDSLQSFPSNALTVTVNKKSKQDPQFTQLRSSWFWWWKERLENSHHGEKPHREKWNQSLRQCSRACNNTVWITLRYCYTQFLHSELTRHTNLHLIFYISLCLAIE